MPSPENIANDHDITIGSNDAIFWRTYLSQHLGYLPPSRAHVNGMVKNVRQDKRSVRLGATGAEYTLGIEAAVANIYSIEELV